MAEITVDWSGIINRVAYTGVDLLGGVAKAQLPSASANTGAPVVVIPPAPVPAPTPPANTAPAAPVPGPEKVRDEGSLSVSRSTLVWGGVGLVVLLLGGAYVMAKK